MRKPAADCPFCGETDDECNLNLEVGDRNPCCDQCSHAEVATTTRHVWSTTQAARFCTVCRLPEAALKAAGLDTDCVPALGPLLRAAYAAGYAEGRR